MTAICRQCKHAMATYRYWRWWMCSKVPLPRAMNYVTGEVDAQNRYVYCRVRNRHGDCPDYDELPEPRQIQQQTLYEP